MPSGHESLQLVDPSRDLSSVFVPVFCLSRFHLPASLCSTAVTPFLRYYGGSVTFRARFFGPSAGHERRSFPESCSLFHVAPTSDHSISPHPMHSCPCAHCSGRRSGREVAALPCRVGFRSGLRHILAGSPMRQAVSSLSFS